MGDEKPNKWIPKGDTATVISGFLIVSGVILAALQVPYNEGLIFAGVGFLLGRKTS